MTLTDTLPRSVAGPLTLARLRGGAPDAHAGEWAACARDAAHFIDAYIVIDEPHGEGVATVPFRLWPDQVSSLARMVLEPLIIFLKARQLGLTWLVCAYGLWLCLFRAGRVVLCFSKTQDDADELIRRFKVMYQRLPEWMRARRPLTVDNMGELAWGNESRVESRAATKGAGRSFAASLVILDEFAFMQYMQETYTAVKPTVDGGGQMFVLSTANGESGLFFDLWDKAVKGINNFVAIFLSWRADPRRTEAWRAQVRADAISSALDRQEYPECVAGDTRFSSRNGISVFGDHPEHCKGEAPIRTLTTSLGYTITATPNHKFYTPGDVWKPLSELVEGDDVCLLPPTFRDSYQKVRIDLGLPIIRHDLLIDEDMAEFLGVYMGDGSASKNKHGDNYTLSIVFDAQDEDSIEKMSVRLTNLFGRVNRRVTGTKKGCVELRLSSKYFGDMLTSLEMIRRNGDGRIKRHVHVPSYILNSPKSVVAAFLRGLFDADGFIGYKAPQVSFFTKHEQFAKDVQLLLLGFGITSRRKHEQKKSGDGHLYTGTKLSLRKLETVLFMDEIGFISDRKNSRWDSVKQKAVVGRMATPIRMSDTVESIMPAGLAPVYDVEIVPEHYYSGNGLWIHNSPEEAFQNTGGENFLPSMDLWDILIDPDLPALTPYEPLILAADAATGRADDKSDCFGLIAVSEHPTRPGELAIRYARKWQAAKGQHIDFDGTEDYPGPIAEAKRLHRDYSVYQFTYDPKELVYVASLLAAEGIFCDPFNQQGERLIGDRLLFDLISQRRLRHTGDPDLREHIANADRQVNSQDRTMRIVKRTESKKIDLSICASMACKRHRDLWPAD